jgi:probable HAF family extracellular repeat protein
VIYNNGVMTDIGGNDARGLNNIGQVVGELSTNGRFHAYLYSNGVLTDLGTLPAHDGSVAQGINDAGVVVGYSLLSNSNNPFGAFIYSNGVMRLLAENAYAFDVNNRGEIVGQTSNDGAFIYSNGRLQILNNLIRVDSGWYLVTAFAINDTGQIVGYGIVNNQMHGFLLTPQ